MNKTVHTRYYKIADITIKVSADLPIKDSTFHPKFKLFQSPGPEKDMISIHHSFSLPQLNKRDLGELVYDKLPWKIYKNHDGWIYKGIYPDLEKEKIFKIARFSHFHTQGRIFHENKDIFESGNRISLTLFPSDQILLARILPDRKGFFLHSAGLVFRDSGLAFVGHSEAGKSTLVKLFRKRAKILCDDRNIIKQNPDGFYIYGTWSHGEVSDVSSGREKLRALFFLNKSKFDKIIPLKNRKEITTLLLDCMVKPLVTPDWWDKAITLAHQTSQQIPCYQLYFTKKGKAVELIDQLLSQSSS